jgi:uncharacterized membrane protein YphA (DoxX/SURF4 family)
LANPRRQFGAWTIVTLVLLRLAVGWHFFHEGMEKIAFDTSENRYAIAFSAEGFLSQATGPLAGWFHDYVPNTHDWERLLAVPRQDAPLTPALQAERDKKLADYKLRRDMKSLRPLRPELDPNAPWFDWEERIVDNWSATAAKVAEALDLSEEQFAAVDKALKARDKQLVDYLKGEAAAITDYQHELWRLEQLRSAPEAAVPFMQQRIATKQAELRGTPQSWVDQVAEFEQNYHEDLRSVLTDDERANPATAAALDEAVNDPRAARLASINKMVTVLTIGVGVCLMLGFFTRLASLAGAAFLLAIMATQPPWAPDAVTTFFYYQCVEFVSFLVLFTVGAGRWLGLDSFSYAVWHRLVGNRGDE